MPTELPQKKVKRMNKNFLTFPMEVLTITQSYTGKTSHLPHTTGTPKDFPIDAGGKDSGRDWIICNADKLVVSKVYGVGTNGTNTVWLTSTEPVVFADGTEDYAVQMFIHPNDDDLKKLKPGMTFRRGEPMFREGKDGATANHIHIAVGKGRIHNTGWRQNTNGKWVLDTTNGTIKPEKAYFIDDTITTTIKRTEGLRFLPYPTFYKTKKKVNVRIGAGTKYDVIEVLPKGAEVTYFESMINSSGNEWVMVGKDRYVNMAHLKKA